MLCMSQSVFDPYGLALPKISKCMNNYKIFKKYADTTRSIYDTAGQLIR